MFRISTCLWGFCVLLVSFASQCLAQPRLFFSFTEAKQLCQVLEAEFSITVTAQLFPTMKNGVNRVASAQSGDLRVRDRGTRVLRWCDRNIAVLKHCQSDQNATESWIGLQFPHHDAVLNFNFSVDGDKVYLRRSFKFDPHKLFSDLSLPSETVSFTEPNDLTLGSVHNSYHCTDEETTSYTESNSDKPRKSDATYTVSVNTKTLRAQAFNLNEPPSGMLGPAITCEVKGTNYELVTAVIVGSAVAVVILVLLGAAAFILAKRRREYDEIDD